MDVGPGPGGNIINWGGPGGEGLGMTGSALRLEESRDGRWSLARRGKHLSSGGVQGGSGGGVRPPFSPGGSGE